MPCRGQGVRIPTLAEVLWAFPAMPVLIEVKEPEVQHAVHRVLVDEDACERCVVASEDDAALDPVPRWPGSLRRVSARDRRALPGGVVPARAPAAAVPVALSVPIRYRGLPVPTRRFVAAARRLGCPVHVWTVNDPATARRLWARGVAGVVTNEPKAMVESRS